MQKCKEDVESVSDSINRLDEEIIPTMKILAGCLDASPVLLRGDLDNVQCILNRSIRDLEGLKNDLESLERVGDAQIKGV